MPLVVKTMQELIDDFINEVQSRNPNLTDTTEGSNLDTLAGATAFLASEAILVALDQFSKTFFSSAGGPEVTGGPDDLQTLAVDHFGIGFERIPAQKATGTVKFTRGITGADVVIPVGTVVKTEKDAEGNEYRFETTEEKTLVGTSIVSAPVIAIETGPGGNLAPDRGLIIESALTDPNVGCYTSETELFSGGSNAQTDAEYRTSIIQRLGNRRLTVKESIEAACLEVPGITTVKALESLMPVIEYDIGTSAIKSGAVFFRIPRCIVYIASNSGTATDSQVAEAVVKVDQVRAYGVGIAIIAAWPLFLNWTLTVSLNSLGPNYATFVSGNTTLIKDTMSQYLIDLPIGSGFSKTTAASAIFAIWGPSGTNDLTACTTTLPASDIAPVTDQKLAPNTMSVV